ncbi:MAG: SoxR reducing system RseC family protein [Rhodocyclales bacterium]|nr:SoxR reducing system RseC family protein [Rhodocyclales bacterium]
MSQCDAVVVDVAGNDAWVELPARAPSCGNCRNTDACVEGLAGNAGVRRYRLANHIGARIGDRVRLNIADGMLWRASLASYVWPLLLAIAGAVLGQGLGDDAWAAGGTLLGLGVGLTLLRRREVQVRDDRELVSLQFPTKEIRFEEQK